MSAASVGADVVQAAQPFLEKPRHLRAGLTLGRPARATDQGHAADGDGGDHGEHGHDAANPPILNGDQDQDPGQQQATAQDLQHELREEGRQSGDVAVDALDQLAGGLGVLEDQIMAQGVGSKVVAQPVGGRPADLFAEPGGRDLRGLDQQGHCNVETGESPKSSHRQDGRARDGAVDEALEDLRADELQSYAGEQQARQDRHTTRLGSEVSLQELGKAEGFGGIYSHRWCRSPPAPRGPPPPRGEGVGVSLPPEEKKSLAPRFSSSLGGGGPPKVVEGASAGRCIGAREALGCPP